LKKLGRKNFDFLENGVEFLRSVCDCEVLLRRSRGSTEWLKKIGFLETFPPQGAKFFLQGVSLKVSLIFYCWSYGCATYVVR